MKTLEQYLIEAKNTHMEHIEDLVFNEGVNGTRKAINFLRDLRNMLAGHSSKKIKTTVKWDGAPAIFAGIDPRDGKFFVAKKGVFNKNPQVFKTPEDIKAELTGDLQTKFLIALEQFSKIGIKKGVYQGDLMFTKGDLKTEVIDGEKYLTFQPNTIVYAIPMYSVLGKRIKRAKIGIVWHTIYSGNSFESMNATFGEHISKKFRNIPAVWQVDATYKDVTGLATFTDAETKHLTGLLSQAGQLFQKIPAKLLDSFHKNPELLLRVKTFNNVKVREGKPIKPSTHVKELTDYIHDFYQKKIDSLKKEDAKEKWREKRKEVMSLFSRYKRVEIERIFVLVNYLVAAKQMIINKMNMAGSIGTFLRTKSGFKSTSPEGYVAIDHMQDAVKIVDRMEFSRANFSPDIIKGWER
jgi:hypothetical protein